MTAATMRKQIALYAAQFPSPGCCTAEGILCAGGDLLPARLLAAYSRGIFPWYGEDMPLLWWCPDPRCVLPLDAFQLPRRSARALRNHPFELRMDTAFSRVIRACAAPRRDGEGTWILPEMIAAYERLHALGYAHSVEAWRDGELLGGLYGVALGRAFFGESMFHRCPRGLAGGPCGPGGVPARAGFPFAGLPAGHAPYAGHGRAGHPPQGIPGAPAAGGACP